MLLTFGNIFLEQRIIMLLTRQDRCLTTFQPAQGMLQRSLIGHMGFAHQGQQAALLGLLQDAQGIGVPPFQYTLQVGAKLNHLLHSIARPIQQHHKALRPQCRGRSGLEATGTVTGLTSKL